MKFEWDERKNRENIKKHSISFEQAQTIFQYKTLTRVDDRREYHEIRKISLGLLDGRTIIVVIHTTRESKTRIITARKENSYEREVYNERTRQDN